MPVVPSPQSNFNNVAVQTVSRPREGAEAFGGAQAQQIGQAGQAIEGTGEEQAHLQGLINRASAKQAFVNAKGAMDDYMVQNVYSLQGLNATPDKINAALSKFQQEEMPKAYQGLNPTQAQMANPLIQGAWNEAKFTAEKHGIEQVHAANKATTEQMGNIFLRDGSMGVEQTQNFDAYKHNLGEQIPGIKDEDAQKIAQGHFGAMVYENVYNLATTNPEQGINLLDSSLKNGVISQADYDVYKQNFQNKTLTVDGKQATQQSRQDYQSLAGLAQENPREFAKTPDSALNEFSRDDRTKAEALIQKARLGVPLNPLDKTIQQRIKLSMTGMWDNSQGAEQEGKGEATDVPAWTKDGLHAYNYVSEKVYQLPADKRTNIDTIDKIIEEAKKPSLFIDQNGAIIKPNYEVPYASGYEKPSGFLNLGRTKLPEGTTPMESYNGKAGNFYRIPSANGHFDIYDLSTNKVIGTATQKEVANDANQ